MQRFKIVKYNLVEETQEDVHENLYYEEAIAHVAKLNRVPYSTIWYCAVPQFAKF